MDSEPLSPECSSWIIFLGIMRNQYVHQIRLVSGFSLGRRVLTRSNGFRAVVTCIQFVDSVVIVYQIRLVSGLSFGRRVLTGSKRCRAVVTCMRFVDLMPGCHAKITCGSYVDQISRNTNNIQILLITN